MLALYFAGDVAAALATYLDARRALADRLGVGPGPELTKLHQEVVRGPLEDVLHGLEQRDLKGEVVLVIEGAETRPSATVDEAAARAAELVRAGATKREAARRVARATGLRSGEIYRALLPARR